MSAKSTGSGRSPTPEDVVGELRNLLQELDGPVVPINAALMNDILGNIIETFALELEYQRRRKYEGIDPIDFLEDSPTRTEVDAKFVREAQALRGQIAKRLEPKAPNR
jgi:hypothetical protein